MALVQNWYLPIVGGALNVPVEKLFPLHGEERKSFLKPSRSSCEVFPPVPLSCVFFVFLFFVFCSGARDQNLTWVTRNKTVMAGYKGSDQEQWSLIYLPTGRITKLRSHKGSGRQEVEVGGEMAQGERVFKSVQARGWQMLGRKLQKNLWSFQTHQCLKSILVSGRFCLTCTREKIQIPQREGNVCRALPLISLWPTPLHSDKSALVLLSIGSNKTLSPHKILFLCVNPNPPPNFL